MARVYLETSFVSAFVTTRKDAASTYRQQVSLDWWRTQASLHKLFISVEVLNELASPAYPSSQAALDFVRDVQVLAIDERVRELAQFLVRERVMPAPDAGDAVHVAVATIGGIEYMLSWNVRHLANVNKTIHLRKVCQRRGLIAPTIITPEALWEDENG